MTVPSRAVRKQSKFDRHIDDRVRRLKHFDDPAFLPLEKLVGSVGGDATAAAFRKNIESAPLQLRLTVPVNFERLCGGKSKT